MKPIWSFVILLAISAVSLPTASVAQSYQAINRLQVFPLGGGDFEVIEARGEGARGMWCAAADYVKARFGQGTTGRIYVKTARGPSVSRPGRKGVVFTLDPNSLAQPASQSLAVTVRSVGVGLPTNHALQFCRDYLLELDDILYRHKR